MCRAKHLAYLKDYYLEHKKDIRKKMQEWRKKHPLYAKRYYLKTKGLTK